jgi:hypothetical protein
VQPLGALVLLALAVILVVTSIVTVNVVRRAKTETGKLLASVAIPIVAILVVFGDELAGVVYMHALCRGEGGIRIYKTVELPAIYFKEASQEFWDGYMPDDKKLKPRFDLHFEDSKRPLRLERSRFVIIDTTNGETLGESVRFGVRCGWFQSIFGLQCGYGCPAGRPIGQLYKQVFRRVHSTN